MKPEEELAEAVRQLNKRLRKVENAVEIVEQRIESLMAMNRASEGKISRNTKEVIELKGKVKALASSHEGPSDKLDLEMGIAPRKNFL